MRATVRVQGLDELVRDFGKLEKELRRNVQRELAEAAKPVADEARARASRYGGRVASGIRPRARGSSAFVRQHNRKITGTRPDFGSLQMRRVLVPALELKRDEVVRSVDRMLGRLAGEAGF